MSVTRGCSVAQCSELQFSVVEFSVIECSELQFSVVEFSVTVCCNRIRSDTVYVEQQSVV